MDEFNKQSQSNIINKYRKLLSIGILIVLVSTILSFFVGFNYAHSSRRLVTEDEYNIIKLLEGMDINKLGKFDLLVKALTYAENNYYEDIDYDRLDKIAALSIINGIDDFSSMTSYNDYIYNSTISVGIGIKLSINIYNEYTVTHILPKHTTDDSYIPAQTSLQRGDIIYAIDGNRIQGLPMSYLNYFTLGDIGKEFTFTIIRDGELMDVMVTKSQYVNRQSYYIDNLGGDISDDIGYIALFSFVGSADKDFAEDYEQFIADGNKAIVLDLRGNTGGSSNILSKVASYLVKDKSSMLGTLLTKVPLIEMYDAANNVTRVYSSDDSSLYNDIPIYVLTNGMTASSSEALIGAMEYYGTGVTIGEKTFGKGVGQFTSPNPLVDNDKEEYSITLVAGYYYIYTHDLDNHPLGKYTIHGIGIEPNYNIKSSFKINLYDDELINKANELYNS